MHDFDFNLNQDLEKHIYHINDNQDLEKTRPMISFYSLLQLMNILEPRVNTIQFLSSKNQILLFENSTSLGVVEWDNGKITKKSIINYLIQNHDIKENK